MINRGKTMNIYLQKKYGILVPADQDAEELIKKMPADQIMKIQYSFPRNAGNHRRFFAFLKLAFDCQEFFNNRHHFRKWLIMKSGHYTTIQTPKGKVIFDADSIAFDSMAEDEFRELFNDCVQAFIDTFGDKLPQDQLDNIVRF